MRTEPTGLNVTRTWVADGGNVFETPTMEHTEQEVELEGHLNVTEEVVGMLTEVRASEECMEVDEFDDEPVYDEDETQELTTETDFDGDHAASAMAQSTAQGQVDLKVNNWRVLWGLLLTSGSQKPTKFRYQSMRMIADTFLRMSPENAAWSKAGLQGRELEMQKTAITCLPHYTTLATNSSPCFSRTSPCKVRTFWSGQTSRKQVQVLSATLPKESRNRLCASSCPVSMLGRIWLQVLFSS